MLPLYPIFVGDPNIDPQGPHGYFTPILRIMVFYIMWVGN